MISYSQKTLDFLGMFFCGGKQQRRDSYLKDHKVNVIPAVTKSPTKEFTPQFLNPPPSPRPASPSTPTIKSPTQFCMLTFNILINLEQLLSSYD